MAYDWEFARLLPYQEAFVQGVWVTIQLSACTIAYALIIGVAWGVALSRSATVRLLTLPLVDILKSLPPLVLILFGYFMLSPAVIGFSASTFLTFIIFVGLNIAAFVADLVRSAITNVSTEFTELGETLGLSERDLLVRVVAPIALRELLAPLAYLAIETVKLTALASIIVVHEMVYVAQAVIQDTTRSFEVWMIVSAVYLALIWPSSFLVRRLEIRLKRAAGLRP